MSISGITKFKPRKSKAQDDMEKFRDLRNHVGETCRITREIPDDKGGWETGYGPWAGTIMEVAMDGRRVRVEWMPPGGPENQGPWLDASLEWWKVQEVVAPKANTITVTLPNFDGRKA